MGAAPFCRAVPRDACDNPRVRGRSGLVVVALVALAFALRIAWQLRVGFYTAPETWEYDAIARNLLEGRGYVYPFLGTDWVTFGLPAYPLVLAALHWLSGGPDRYLFVGLAQAALAASVVLVAVRVGQRLAGRAAGLLAGAIVAVHPALVLYAAKVHELNLEAPVAGLVLVAALEAARAPITRRVLGLGASAALAALIRPTIAVFGVAALAAFAIRGPRRAAFAGLLVLALGIAPTTLRNTLVLEGGTVPGTCMQLWVGNNPNASGSAFTVDGRSVFDAMPDDLRRRVTGASEREQGRAFCDAIAAYVAADPPGALGRWALRFGYFWWFAPSAGVWYPAGWIDVYKVGYALEVLLAAIGAAAVWRRGGRLALGTVALQFLAIAAAQTVSYVEGRHRLLLEPGIAALAAVGALAFVGAARNRLGPRRGAPSRGC